MKRLRSATLTSGWQFACRRWLSLPTKLAFSPLEWLPAEVPGHVHLDLVRAGVIAHPFEALAELGCQWIDGEDWCYETTFDVAMDELLPRRVLRFEGLDTVCVVFLNGDEIGRHDNMFVPLEVDVSERLKSRGNVLRIEFESAVRMGNARRERYLAEHGLGLDTERFDERAFVRKAQYMFGWDWGPRLVSAGIWQPVRLLEFQARIESVQVRQEHLPNGAVALSVRTEVDGEADVVHVVDVAGVEHRLADEEVLTIEQPELWWPVGMGEPKLYGIESYCLPKGTPKASVGSLDARVYDRRTTRVGLRRVELLQRPDALGQSFGFVVNGRKLWAFGANWIPDHSFPSQITRARLREQLERACDMHMNMLRIWGGGVYESDDFYDLCDELGILVWQDFPFACNYAPDDEAARRAMQREAEVNVKRLRNRASLAIWCGNNENLTMYESKWGDEAHHPDRYHGERIWNGTLPRLLEQLDPERPYVASSPMGGPVANADEVGDQHNWDVWHGRGDWIHYTESKGRFISELGFAAAPGPRAWQTALGERLLDEVSLRDRVARWHDKTGKGYETFIGYVELHYPPATTLAEWTYFSQLNQRDAMRAAIEHYRSGSFCQGTLIWQLNDCWPVQSWALLDSEGDYKAAAFELRRLFAPLLASVHLEGDLARIVVALDNTKAPREAELGVELRRLGDGTLLSSSTLQVRLSPGERREFLSVDLGAVDRKRTSLTIMLGGTTTCRLLCEPKQAELSKPRLRAGFSDAGLELESDAPVFDLFVFNDDGTLSLHDNFVTLPAGGRRLLRANGSAERLRARSIVGEHVVELF